MKKIHIVRKYPVTDNGFTLCGRKVFKTAPFNVTREHMEAVKESYLCKKCLGIHEHLANQAN